MKSGFGKYETARIFFRIAERGMVNFALNNFESLFTHYYESGYSEVPMIAPSQSMFSTIERWNEFHNSKFNRLSGDSIHYIAAWLDFISDSFVASAFAVNSARYEIE